MKRETSPLALVTDEQDLHRFLRRLADARRQIEGRGAAEIVKLSFSRREIDDVLAAFSRSILRGESRLHRLCDLLCGALFDDGHAITSVVIGEVPGDGERFTLTHPIARETLYTTTDLALGTRVLADIQVRRELGWVQPALVANVVEYQPRSQNRWHVHKMISRIKAEEEIWNKVVDELFDIDSLVRRDKELSQHSRFVKDVFGIKIIVQDVAHARALHTWLVDLDFDAQALAGAEAPETPAARELVFFETKDYLDGYGKRSGWGAIKSVLTWWDTMFEVQLQTLENYFSEREVLTRESHAGFKRSREALRDRIANDVPLFGFMRELLRWLFGSAGDLPTFEGVEVELREG